MVNKKVYIKQLKIISRLCQLSFCGIYVLMKEVKEAGGLTVS